MFFFIRHVYYYILSEYKNPVLEPNNHITPAASNSDDDDLKVNILQINFLRPFLYIYFCINHIHNTLALGISPWYMKIQVSIRFLTTSVRIYYICCMRGSCAADRAVFRCAHADVSAYDTVHTAPCGVSCSLHSLLYLYLSHRHIVLDSRTHALLHLFPYKLLFCSVSLPLHVMVPMIHLQQIMHLIFNKNNTKFLRLSRTD